MITAILIASLSGLLQLQGRMRAVLQPRAAGAAAKAP